MSIADEVAKLAKLREEGALSEDEFARAKANLLQGGPPVVDPPVAVSSSAVATRTDQVPIEASAEPPMPTADKWCWFLVIPAIWLGLAAVIPQAYEHPLPYLADLLLVGAVVSWIARRPYMGWAKTFRIVVAVLAVLVIITSASQQAASLGLPVPGANGPSAQELASELKSAGIACPREQSYDAPKGSDVSCVITQGVNGVGVNYSINQFDDPGAVEELLLGMQCLEGGTLPKTNYLVIGETWFVQATHPDLAQRIHSVLGGEYRSLCG